MDVIFKESNVLYNVLCFFITENEKLFDRSDARLYWRTVLHLIVLYHHAFVGIFAENLGNSLKASPSSDVQMLYYFRMAYLTGWNVLFQTVFLLLALSHDFLEWTSKQDSTIAAKIRYWRDLVFSALVIPYTCFVFGMFWGLYAIDRELVFPKVYDQVVPWWFNQCVHSNILALIVVETILQPRRYPTSRRRELTWIACVGILYAVVYYSIYFFAGRWLYNVFSIMNWWQVCLYQVLIWLSSYVFYEMQWFCNRAIHGKEPMPEKEAISENNNGSTKPTGIEQNIGEFENEQSDFRKNADMNSINADFTVSTPFSNKSWSLKYRNMRNEFENSKL